MIMMLHFPLLLVVVIYFCVGVSKLLSFQFDRNLPLGIEMKEKKLEKEEKSVKENIDSILQMKNTKD